MSAWFFWATLHLTAANVDNLGDHARAPHVHVRLLTEQDAVAAGEPFYAGVHFNLDPNWHVYWQYPGDSGQAPQVSWTLPEGFNAEPIAWPLPRRIPLSQLMNYGYENEVLLPIPMRAPKTWTGPDATLTAKVRWLVCAELCIPGNATLQTVVKRADANHVHPDDGPLFAAARRSVPIPAPATWKTAGTLGADAFTLTFETAEAPVHAVFLPTTALQINNSAKQTFAALPHGFRLSVARSDQLNDGLSLLSGVVVTETRDGAATGYSVDIPLQAESTPSLPLILLLALGGGVILNLMPCVFPVLSIKVMSLAHMSGQDRNRIRWHAWLYGAGVLVAFWALTAALLVLRHLGQQIGWGFQLQSPRFVVGLVALLFALGLNLLGTFEIGNSLTGAGQSLANRSGGVGAFFTGMLATVVATPCTAPFMGTAVGFALSQSNAVCVLVFTALATGLAFPYLAVSYMPGIGRILPRPGAWMVTLRQFIAFLLLGTVVWLVWVFGQQTNNHAVAGLLAGLLILALGAWMLGRWPQHRLVGLGAVAVMLTGLGVGLYNADGKPLPNASAQADGELLWEPFSPERVTALRQQGRPVFIDFTAAWCVSCQVNEAVVFGSQTVRQKLKDLNVALIKADWTSQDPVITQTLATFGRSGVPLYVLYGRNKEAPAVRLPEVITAGLVLDELNKLQ